MGRSNAVLTNEGEEEAKAADAGDQPTPKEAQVVTQKIRE